MGNGWNLLIPHGSPSLISEYRSALLEESCYSQVAQQSQAPAVHYKNYNFKWEALVSDISLDFTGSSHASIAQTLYESGAFGNPGHKIYERRPGLTFSS